MRTGRAKASPNFNPYPAATEVVRIRDDVAVKYRTCIADRDGLPWPVTRQYLYASGHVTGAHVRAGLDMPRGLIRKCEFDMGAAYIDDQYIHENQLPRPTEHRRMTPT